MIYTFKSIVKLRTINTTIAIVVLMDTNQPGNLPVARQANPILYTYYMDILCVNNFVYNFTTYFAIV